MHVSSQGMRYLPITFMLHRASQVRKHPSSASTVACFAAASLGRAGTQGEPAGTSPMLVTGSARTLVFHTPDNAICAFLRARSSWGGETGRMVQSSFAVHNSP